jgi:1A family penicillin-binding protein
MQKLLQAALRFILQSLYIILVVVDTIGEGAKVCLLSPIIFFKFLYRNMRKIKYKAIVNATPLPKKQIKKWKTTKIKHVPHQSEKHIVVFPKKTNRIAQFFTTPLIVRPKALFITLLILFLSGLSGYGVWYIIKDLPDPNLIGKVNYPQTTTVYDRNGIVLYEFYKDQNRIPVSLNNVPLHVQNAFIAIEDKDFRKHNGISISSGILRAIKDNFLTQGELGIQGGSTITQQLVKTSLLKPEKTIKRKAQEIILALWAERIYTKDQILELYLNHVPFGGTSYGIEQASKAYFNKSIKDVSIAEAAMLAGLPQSPSVYSPYYNLNAALLRRGDVLSAILREGYITREEYQIAKANVPILGSNENYIKAPHFVFYIKDILEAKFGEKKVLEGGLKVYTTLDYTLQQQTEKIVTDEVAKIKFANVTNGAAIVTRPNTGELLAMVGSVNYYASPFGSFNVATALRQPGSSLKPLVYSLALERGFTAGSILDDSPKSYRMFDGTFYSPKNYDGKYRGRISLRYALSNSYNLPAVKMLDTLGVENYINFAEKLGITTWKDRSRFGLSLALGGGEVYMSDLATAYGTLANGGERVDVDPLLSVVDKNGDIIYKAEPTKKRVISAATSYIMADIMSDTVARLSAFGPNNFLSIPGYKIAAKTGTTDNLKDNWTVGFTPEFTTIVWVGNNNGDFMNRNLASGITGAAPIWNRIMQTVLEKGPKPNVWYQKPSNLVEKPCFAGRNEVFVSGTQNNVPCTVAPSISTTVGPGN